MLVQRRHRPSDTQEAMSAELPYVRSAEIPHDLNLQTVWVYDGRRVHPTGGFFHYFKDDGTVYDRSTRHLVSSTRFVFTHAMAARHFPGHPRASTWLSAARHGLDFVRHVHRDPATGGYAWVLRWNGSG